MAIDRLPPATPVASSPATHGQVPALTAGQVIDARVLNVLQGGLVRLLVAGGTIEAQAGAALAPGAQVRLRVVDEGGTLKLVPIERGQDRTVATATAGLLGEAADPQAAAAAPQTAGSSALARALQVAVARQSGLAPLFADLQAAISPSGQPGTASAKAAPSASLAADIGTAASAASSTAGAAQALPATVQRAAAAVLAFRLDADQPITAPQVEAAFARSGLFREALMARVDPSSVQTTSATGGGLTTLSPSGLLEALVPGVTGRDATRLSPQVIDALKAAFLPDSASATPLAPADLKSALLGLRAALLAAFADLEPAPTPPDRRARPPRRGDLPSSQAASTTSLPSNATPRDQARALLAETDGALARITLAQIASSDAGTGPTGGGRTDASTQNGTFLFEVPLLAGGRTSMAQIEIGRDDKPAAGAGGATNGWRVRFALDVEPAGPVQALMTLSGDRLTTTLWAERPQTGARLRAAADSFASAFADTTLTVERLQVRAGRPDTPPPPDQHFLDRRS